MFYNHAHKNKDNDLNYDLQGLTT